MHKVYRQLLLALVSIILLISTCNRCNRRQAAGQNSIPGLEENQSGWSPVLEQQMRHILYTQSTRITTNEAERNQYADCCMSKIKEMYPNGVPNMASGISDSLTIALMKMGEDCIKSLKSYRTLWLPEVVEQLKLPIYSYAETKMLPQKMKKEYVDCIAYAVIAKYPNGFENRSKDSLKKFITAQRTRCLKMIVNKYGKLKINKTVPDTTEK